MADRKPDTATEHPKTDAPGNAAKDPDTWTTGDEPMTGAQASYLQTLSEEAGEEFDPGLSKAEASKRIDALQEQDRPGELRPPADPVPEADQALRRARRRPASPARPRPSMATDAGTGTGATAKPSSVPKPSGAAAAKLAMPVSRSMV